MKRSEDLAVTGADNFEGFFSRATEAIYGKLIVEACSARDSEPLHHRKAGSIDDGEILVTEGEADCPSAFEVRGGDQFDMYAATPNAIPK